jgi:hypothetical protein
LCSILRAFSWNSLSFCHPERSPAAPEHHYWLQANTLIEDPLACVPGELPASRK